MRDRAPLLSVSVSRCKIAIVIVVGKVMKTLRAVLFAVLLPGIAAAQGEILSWGNQVAVSQESLTDLIAIAGGYSHSLGLKADGTIVPWGHGGYGQCDVPAPNAGFVAVAAGFSHSLMLTSFRSKSVAVFRESRVEYLLQSLK